MEIGSIFARLGVLGGREFDQALGRAEDKFRTVGRNMVKFGAIAAPLGLIAKSAVQAFQVQENALAQVRQGLESTAGQVGLTFQELQREASKLQEVSIFGDERILKDVTAQLLTFTNIAGTAFTRTQQAALDLATRLDGDLKSASIQLGKALNDPVANLSALSRSGIQFSDVQTDLIKNLAETGRLAQAQSVILDELERQYGGSAAAAARTFGGSIDQVRNAWGDFMEGVGSGVATVLAPMIGALRGATKWFTGLSDGMKSAIGITLTVTAGVGALSAAIGGFMLVASPMAIAISGIVAALAALGAGIYLLIKNWDALTGRVDAAMKGIAAAVARGAADAIDVLVDLAAKVVGVGSALGALVPGFQGAANSALKLIAPMIGTADALRDTATGMEAASKVARAAAPEWQGFGAVVDSAKETMGGLMPAIGDIESSTEQAGDAADGAAEKVTKWVSAYRQLFAIRGQFSREDFKPEKGKLAGFETSGLPTPVPREARAEGLPTAEENIARLTEGATNFGVLVAKLGEQMRFALVDGTLEFADAMGDAFGAFATGAQSMKATLSQIGDSLKQVIRDLVAAMVRVLAMKALISALGLVGGGFFGGAASMLTQATGIRAFASGGIVTKPTLGLVGERGPEAIVPLNRMNQIQPQVQPVLRVGIGELFVELQRYGRENGLQMG